MNLGSKTLKWSLHAAIATLFALAACDSTAPRDTLDVTIALASTGGPTISSNVDGTPRVSCQLNFSLTASGKVNATWENAIYRFYIGKDRTTAADTSVIGVADVVDGAGDTI